MGKYRYHFIIMGVFLAATACTENEPVGQVRDSVNRASCVVPPKGMISWWTADGHLDDVVGNNDASLYLGSAGNTDPGAAFVRGMVGETISFDGEDDWARIPPSNTLDPGAGSFTIELWMQGFELDTFSSALIKNGFSDGRWGISVADQIAFDVLRDGMGGLVRFFGVAAHQ